MSFNEREIEHVDHTPLQERGISALFRKQGGDLVQASVEYYAVEHTVDDVSECATANHRESEQHARRGMVFEQSGDVPSDTAHGNNAEEAQEQLPELSVAEFHAERHAVVFHKQKPEPVEHDNLLTQHQVGFNPYFDRLVDD